MTHFNLILVQTGSYPTEYAGKIASMMRKYCQIPFTAYCFSDNPAVLPPEITPIPIPFVYHHWWNKCYVYSDLCPNGWLVYLDLDQIIRADITDIIDYAMNNTKEIACFSDHIEWHNTKFNSSFMVLRKGALRHVFQKFLAEYPNIINFPGGDQVWVAPQLQNILYLNEKFPDMVKSFKFDILQKQGENHVLLPEKYYATRIINFHGRPKPHELLYLDIIKDNWG